MEKKQLQKWARKIRFESLKMMYNCPAGHPGGTMSVADILAVLYFSELNINPKTPKWPDRDRVILSKGHACAALYAALGLRDFFERTQFSRFRRIDGILEGHPSITIPGVDAPSGSLGLGLSQGLGMALGARCTRKSFRVYVILGDGDMQEGATWEAIMAAGYHRMDNLCVILDYNKIQAEDTVENTMNFAPIVDKLKAFHWVVKEIDGHDCEQIQEALRQAKLHKGNPYFLVANTIKGKGISFMENQTKWHGAIPLSDQEFAKASAELDI